MRVLVSIVALLLSAASAQAQRHVVNGQSIQLGFFSSTNPDCTPRGYPVINITQQPQHGRVRTTRGNDFVRFPESNVRSVCNRRRVPGVGIYYTAERGYAGYDMVGAEVIFPSGNYRRGSYNINVR
jgi:hypothetical protein